MLRRILKNEKGQSIVEFALVVPILLTLLCGIIDFGWIYSNQYKVENASYAGARYASLYVSDYNSSNMNELIDKIDNRVKENLWNNGEGANVTVNITSDKIDVTVVYPVKNLTYVAQTFLENIIRQNQLVLHLFKARSDYEENIHYCYNFSSHMRNFTI